MTTAERLEQLRDLPLVTAADRERYKQWEQGARAELAEVEPEHARDERKEYQFARKFDRVDTLPHWPVLRLGDVISNSEWRSHWRSLPDYDGPPMRTPSGVMIRFVRETRAEDEELVFGSGVVPVFVAPISGGHPLRHLLEAHLIKKHPQKKREIPDETFYLPPSKGGRGWCPKLAEVSE